MTHNEHVGVVAAREPSRSAAKLALARCLTRRRKPAQHFSQD
jgi:hypothetical protein